MAFSPLRALHENEGKKLVWHRDFGEICTTIIVRCESIDGPSDVPAMCRLFPFFCSARSRTSCCSGARWAPIPPRERLTRSVFELRGRLSCTSFRPATPKRLLVVRDFAPPVHFFIHDYCRGDERTEFSLWRALGEAGMDGGSRIHKYFIYYIERVFWGIGDT